MKRMLCLLAGLLLLWGSAMAEEFDQPALEALEGYEVTMDAWQVNTIVRPEGQPYEGTMDASDAELLTFLDFIQMPDEDATFLRLTLCLTSYEFIGAGELTVTVNGTDYIFNVFPEVSEYDAVYFEDYSVCMTAESLPMIKAMARSRSDTFAIRLAGAEEYTGAITLPLDTVAEMYDTYIDLGGAKQNLEICRDLWPVMIVKEQ